VNDMNAINVGYVLHCGFDIKHIFPCISVCHCQVTQFEGTPGMACMHIVKDIQRCN